MSTSDAGMMPPAVVTPEQRRYVRSFLLILFVVNLLNYIDRLAIAGLLEPIRKEFGATDSDMGLVGLAFTLTYAVLPPVFGWLGDRWARTLVIAASAAFWSVATAVTGSARNVTQLVLTRGAVGVGEASYMSNAPNLIADLVPAARRGSAMAFFYIASPVGAALGVMLAGVLANAWGWRAACWIVGLPGIITALVMVRFREPVRGNLDTAEPVIAPSFGTALRELISNRAFVLLALGYTGQIFLQNAVEYWLPTILQRDKAIPLLEANAMYGWVLLPAGIIGPLAGSFLADRLLKGGQRAYFLVCTVTSFATLVPLFAIAVTQSRVPLFSAVFVQYIVAYMSTPLVLALAVTVVSPGIRSTATAVLLTTVHLLGDAISQPLVGKVSTALETGVIPPGVARALAGLLQTSADAHLTIAFFAVLAPAALVAGVIYSAGLGRAKPLTSSASLTRA